MMIFIETLQELFACSEIIVTDEEEIQYSKTVEKDVFKMNFCKLELLLRGEL